MAAIIAGGAVALAAVVGVIVVATSGGDKGNQGDGPHPTPSPSSSSETPTASPTPADDPFESNSPSPTATDRKIPFFQIKKGDCFNLPVGGGGTNEVKSCYSPHDAEVVATHQLTGSYTTSSEIQEQASSLCRLDWQLAVKRQPPGTAEGTYVQFPKISGYNMGIKTVSCSLIGNRTNTKKLTKPLS
ncbi:hypothetical protein [Streptomyces sp. NPDC003077]|uniref:hypothetical protein n=1 Tax=Streptomyces sp. NPDC003077 TaxID=3154443 RepID=UPI0033B3637D